MKIMSKYVVQVCLSQNNRREIFLLSNFVIIFDCRGINEEPFFCHEVLDTGYIDFILDQNPIFHHCSVFYIFGWLNVDDNRMMIIVFRKPSLAEFPSTYY